MPTGETATHAPAGETYTHTAAGETNASAQPATAQSADQEVLGRPEWILSPEALAAADQVEPFTHRRWRHPGLDDLLTRGADRQPDWHAALHSHNPVVRANAAIALARQGDGSGSEHLAAAVRDPALALPLRCAAAEALGELPGAAATGLLGELVDQYGRSGGATDNGAAFYVPELHAELIRALAGRATPEDQTRLLRALCSPAAEVRLEALRAWMLQLERSRGLPDRTARSSAEREDLPARTRALAAEVRPPRPQASELQSELWDLPAEVIDQRSHDDWRVRSAAVRLIGLGSPQRTHEYLKTALQDHDWRVRVAAIESLGLVGDQQAQEMLAGLHADRVERIRAAVVDALAAAGRRDKVFEALGDESWRVRRQVARALAAWPDESSKRVAWGLLDDPSAEVQLAVVEAVGQWPLELAGNILLSAMDRPSLMTRQAAFCPRPRPCDAAN